MLHRLNRRSFLTEFGRGTVAVAILGPTVVACSSTTTDSDAAGFSSTTPSASEPPSTTAATSPTEPDTTGDSADALPLQWERVSLGFVSAYVLARGNELAIVDTGVDGSDDQIEQAVRTLGGTWNDVNHVILTHLHPDHVGGLGGVMDSALNATAYAGEADVAGILSPRAIGAVNDGDEVFGLQIIGTPGHTAGHISVLDPVAGFLVAGDALNESGGEILGPNPDFTDDLGRANESVRTLATRQFDTAVFGHGEPFVGEASEAVVALADSL